MKIQNQSSATMENESLKLRIIVDKVESDGILMNGIIHATFDGSEIQIYDDREVREPRLKTGDTITIYAVGDGLTTVTTYKEGSGLFGSILLGEVESEKQIPYVRMKYTDLDNLESFGIGSVIPRSEDDFDKRADQIIDDINSMIDNFADYADSIG